MHMYARQQLTLYQMDVTCRASLKVVSHLLLGKCLKDMYALFLVINVSHVPLSEVVCMCMQPIS